MPPLEIKEVDRAFYEKRLAGFLPLRMIDIHTHVWLQGATPAQPSTRGAKWPSKVAAENSIEELFDTYRLMFPETELRPLLFGSAREDVIFDEANGYVSRVAREHKLPSLLLSTPEWSAEEVDRLVREGGFLGLKPYLSYAPAHIPADEITIYDYLPHAHLEIANRHGWIVMLHIPRRERLKDPVNLAQLVEIERDYPDVRLIVAHIGRAYCPEDVGNAFEVLQQTERLRFDFSANTNSQVMRQLLEAVGPQRVLFGSDLPILRMRMRRLCEKGVYINVVPPGLYGDVSDDPHMREVSQEAGERLTFFMYEELSAFRRAAEMVGLSREDVEAVFYGNAAQLLRDVSTRLYGDAGRLTV